MIEVLSYVFVDLTILFIILFLLPLWLIKSKWDNKKPFITIWMWSYIFLFVLFGYILSSLLSYTLLLLIDEFVLSIKNSLMFAWMQYILPFILIPFSVVYYTFYCFIYEKRNTKEQLNNDKKISSNK